MHAPCTNGRLRGGLEGPLPLQITPAPFWCLLTTHRGWGAGRDSGRGSFGGQVVSCTSWTAQLATGGSSRSCPRALCARTISAEFLLWLDKVAR